MSSLQAAPSSLPTHRPADRHKEASRYCGGAPAFCMCGREGHRVEALERLHLQMTDPLCSEGRGWQWKKDFFQGRNSFWQEFPLKWGSCDNLMNTAWGVWGKNWSCCCLSYRLPKVAWSQSEAREKPLKTPESLTTKKSKDSPDLPLKMGKSFTNDSCFSYSARIQTAPSPPFVCTKRSKEESPLPA